MKRLLVFGLVTVLAAGCATAFPTPMQQVVTLHSGEVLEYVTTEATNSTGMNSRQVDSYFHNPKTGELVLFTKDGYAGQGLWTGFMQGGFAGLAQGAGFATGMALMRPSNTNVGGGTSITEQGQSQGQAQQQKQIIKQGYQQHFGFGL